MPDLPAAAKDRGHIAELTFALEAKKRGFTVLTTGGDNAAFDVVLYKDGRFSRVQVKSCLHKEPNRNRHTFSVKRGGGNTHRCYRTEDVDVMALYAFDTGDWYFIPLELIRESKTVKIDLGCRYEQFRHNWSIFS